MLKFMLDTNICIFTIKNKPAHIRERIQSEYRANVHQLSDRDGTGIRC